MTDNAFTYRRTADNAPAESSGPDWVDLDTVLAGPGTAQEELDKWIATDLAARGIGARILVESGPAGGNPIVRFTGKRDALIDLLRTNFDYEGPEIKEYFPDYEYYGD